MVSLSSNKMTDTLYIIGNGFDLHHGLRTSYANFRDDYAHKKCKLWNSLTTIFGDKLNDNMWWSDFENQLGQIDYSYGMDSHRGIVPWILEIENLLKNEIPPLFGYWLKDINVRVAVDEELGINPSADFFTFNYTMLLEKAYLVDNNNVWHIHRSIDDYIKKGENPIVGHDSTLAEQASRFNEFRKTHPDFRPDIGDMINHNIVKGAKMVKDKIYVHDLNNRFNQYSDIKHFIAMGFSFNDIDLPYIEKIINVNRNIVDADWTLYIHSPKDYDAINKLLSLGINKSKITTKNW